MSAGGVVVGDYVLATRWSDGDPCDPFVVGFVVEIRGRKYRVWHAPGVEMGRHYDRVEKITPEEGEALVAIFPHITDREGPSLWDHLDRIRGSAARDVALRGKIEAAYARWTRRAPFLLLRSGAGDVSSQVDRLDAIFRGAYPFADGPEAWVWDPLLWRVGPWN